MINTAQSKQLRTVIEQYGNCPFKDEEMTGIYNLLFGHGEPFFSGGRSYREVGRTLRHLRRYVVQFDLYSIEKLAAHLQKRKEEDWAYIQAAVKLSPKDREALRAEKKKNRPQNNLS